MKRIAVILGHGDFPEGIKTALETILGEQEEIIPVSNRKLSLKALTEMLAEIFKKNKNKEIFVFVDILGGSCGSAAAQARENKKNIHIIGGVNLPMLVEFFWKKNIKGEELIEKAKKGIRKI